MCSLSEHIKRRDSRNYSLAQTKSGAGEEFKSGKAVRFCFGAGKPNSKGSAPYVFAYLALNY